jgi:hypothetical protein
MAVAFRLRMRILPAGLGALFVVGAAMVVGCDDDRGAADLGSGGDGAAQAGTGALAGEGGTSSAGGAKPEAGGGGQAPLGDCPSDVPAAVGTSCRNFVEGDVCQDEDRDYPCGLEGAIRCVSGTWRWIEPPPCGDGGAGGAGGAPECPADLSEAEGTSCRGLPFGFSCSDGGSDPCQFGLGIVCLDGTWYREEAFPAPCGGAGGSG